MPDNLAGTEVAIIGMTGRFPGARNLDEFWKNLCNGVESIRFPSDEELKALGVDEALLQDPSYVKATAALDGMELFDATFFGYTPREAELMDPQHRIFLECAWEALEHAGYDPEAYPGAIGIFAGSATNTYMLFNLISHRELLGSLDEVQIDVGNGADFMATRASYKLNLKGPSCTLLTACSTSLVAVHLACQSLLNEECDMALAGGITVHVKHSEGYRYMEGSVVSSDGRCRAFDAKANGIPFGSGVGLVMLKRLQDAIADRDHIHAVILGSAINNDGSVKVGYTAPSVEGQAAVITQALSAAGVRPDTISYVEAHGTGTKMGDPIEIRALNKVFRASASATNKCPIGSVKTNIGHLAAAAGVAGLIKTVMALEHRLIPPSINFETPNPDCDLANSPFYVNTQLTEWKSDGGPRRAGVSSFGIGGTNAHVVLEEAPAQERYESFRPVQLLLLSAKTNTALEAATANLARHLKEQPDLNLADVAYTLAAGRQPLGRRRTVVCRSVDDAASILEACDPQRVFAGAPNVQDRPVAFMFPGQGAQYVNMARELYQVEPVLREHVDRCTELLRPQLGLDLRELLYPNAERIEQATQQLNQTGFTQPALFVIEYALAQLWMSWGIRPQAMIGHSIGEYVAACLAGVFSLEDALALVVERGRLMGGLTGGAMLSVSLPEEQVQPLLGQELALAAKNGPSLCVVSGPAGAIDEMAQLLAGRGAELRRLRISVAAHSKLVEPILGDFIRVTGKLHLQPPQIPYVSNVTGTWITDAEATDPHYWVRHLRQAVRFSDGIQEILKETSRALLEVGPGRTLGALTKNHLDNVAERIVLSSIRHPQDEQSDEVFLLNTLGKLWLAGVQVDWAGFYARERRHRLPLPTYPFDRQRYWIEPGAQAGEALGPLRKKANVADWFYAPAWKSSPARLFQPDDLTDYKGGWLLFVDEFGLGAEMAQRLRQAGQHVITVSAGEQLRQINEDACTINPRQREMYATLLEQIGALPERIVHLWSLTPNAGASSGVAFFEQCQERGFYSLLFLAQALGKREHTGSIQLLVVSDCTQRVAESEATSPEKAALSGVCGVIPAEYPNIVCRYVDVSLPPTGTLRGARLVDQLLAEINTPLVETTLAYRGNQRWARTFEPMPLGLRQEPIRPLRPGGIYLITGGLVGVGLNLAKYLAQSVQARLVLVGDDPDSQDTVRALEASGAEVMTIQADVADEAQMQAAVAQAIARFGRLHGVVHAAGVADERALATIQDTDDAVCRRHFRPKVYGLFALEKALRGAELDFCLLNSSLSTVLGGLGYAAYAAADSFMDAFAQKQNEADRTLWVSVDWDAWQLEGQAQEMIAARAEWAQLALTPEEGGEAFRRILAASVTDHVLVSTSDLAVRIEQERQKIQALGGEGRLEQLELHERPELASTFVAPRNELERQVAEIWQQVLGIKQVGVYDDFFELGGHSLLATQLRNHLYQVFKVEFTIRNLFENATVAGVAQLVEKGLSQASAREEKPIAERLRIAFPTERQGVMEEYLKPKIAQALNVEAAQLPADGSLAAFDLELAAVDLMWHLKQDFNLQFYPHEITAIPSIPGLAQYFVIEIERAADLTQLATARPLSSYKLRPYRKRTAGRQAALSPAGKNKSMVFLHSSPRAGSTLLRIMLAGHPDLFCPPELNILFFEDMQEWRENIGFGHELEWTSAGVQWAFMELLGLESDQGQTFVDDLVARNESVRQVYARLQELSGARILLDKTPTYSMDMETLERAEMLFDKPKYVYLFRHPYAVIESLLRVRLDKLFGPSLFEEKDVDPYVVAETVWAISNRNLLQFLERVQPERYHFVRYEDLVGDPARVMTDLCRFLGVPFNEELLKPYDGRRERMIGGLGDPNILQHNSIDPKLGNAWEGIRLPRYLDPSTKQLATRLGYELPERVEAPLAAGLSQSSIGQDEAQLLANLDQLSDEQVQALLQELLAKEKGE